VVQECLVWILCRPSTLDGNKQVNCVKSKMGFRKRVRKERSAVNGEETGLARKLIPGNYVGGRNVPFEEKITIRGDLRQERYKGSLT